ncbi:hypothetical protein Pmani_007493 [Petrolisthes manimaculis]|uniref:Uncharacterized protein n=1 Tax=Petrolisthes manimaculis TaxID=1843537 RepID=A0AAE1UK42_9EUCA|nr:hypothetical protein Pmani_007493 [Petrolisthes manimaculis]
MEHEKRGGGIGGKRGEEELEGKGEGERGRRGMGGKKGGGGVKERRNGNEIVTEEWKGGKSREGREGEAGKGGREKQGREGKGGMEVDLQEDTTPSFVYSPGKPLKSPVPPLSPLPLTSPRVTNTTEGTRGRGRAGQGEGKGGEGEGQGEGQGGRGTEGCIG